LISARRTSPSRCTSAHPFHGIGDALQRSLRLLGHRVISDNHIGDWGTQFGKLLLGWKQILNRAELERDAIANSNDSTKSSTPNVMPTRAARRSKAELVKLQAGDTENIAIWKEMIRLSQFSSTRFMPGSA